MEYIYEMSVEILIQLIFILN